MTRVAKTNRDEDETGDRVISLQWEYVEKEEM